MISENHRFIFICGLHRSGTSLLFKILREQDDFSGFRDTGKPEDEGQHLQSIFKPAIAFGGPGKFGFNDEAYLNEESDLITEENNLKLFREWSKYWDLDKNYLLEKSPPNLIRTRYLQEVFPNSYFITILRHPLAVSFATKKWSRTSIYSLLKHWIRCYSIFDQDKSHLRNYIVIKYEDLISDPGSAIKIISDFLSSSLDVPGDIQIKQNVNQKYFQKWAKYQKGLFSRKMAKKIRTELEEEVEKFGYSLINL